MSAYRALVRLYPRSFREAYAEDLQLLLRDQLRDEPALRVWSRALLDLALTVPAQHLESRMARPPAPAALYGALSAVSLAVAALGVLVAGLSVLGAVGLVVFVPLTVVAWRRSQALGDGSHAAAHWWKYLVAGATGLVVALLSVAGRDELAAGPWALFAATLLTSVALLATGLVLLAVRHRPAA
jgi:hypothetical protein